MKEFWAETAWFNSSQKIIDQDRMVLKRGCFFWSWHQKICQQVNKERYQQHPYPNRNQNSEKQEHTSRIEIQNNKNWNATHRNTTKQMIRQKDKTDAELIKKAMTEKKTTLPSPRNKDWKKLK